MNSVNWFINEIILADLSLSLNPKIYDSVNFTNPSSKNKIHIAQIFILEAFIKWAEIALLL